MAKQFQIIKDDEFYSSDEYASMTWEEKEVKLKRDVRKYKAGIPIVSTLVGALGLFFGYMSSHSPTPTQDRTPQSITYILGSDTVDQFTIDENSSTRETLERWTQIDNNRIARLDSIHEVKLEAEKFKGLEYKAKAQRYDNLPENIKDNFVGNSYSPNQ